MNKGSLFSKRIQVFKQNIDENGRDYGEDTNFIVLDKKLILLEVKILGTVWIKDFDIKNINIFKMDLNNDKSVIGRAIAGGLLLGGVGAVIGGLSATSKNMSWVCEIIEKDNSITLLRIKDEKSMKLLKKWIDKNVREK